MRTVAIAEDQALFRKAMVALINTFDNYHIVEEADSGKALIDKLKNNLLPDIVLLDLRMPELNGIQTTEYLRKHNKDIKIIVISAHDDPDIIVHMYEMGVNAYLDKNADPEEVHKALNQVYDYGLYIGEQTRAAMSELSGSSNPHDFRLGRASRLSDREIEVLQLLCKQYNNNEIASKLCISKRTVDGYRCKLLDKTGSKNTVGLVLFAVKNKLLNHAQLRIS
ncbi:MAG: DNA-binding response regulator [Verrucomicrobia bacterium]|nr:DNA-binding response regulator [Verrucomicrobiota bacterium]|tara:strand:+ start:145 stop:813 length:669 start_codon:yes stop_codon:yes gene_type:complete